MDRAGLLVTGLTATIALAYVAGVEAFGDKLILLLCVDAVWLPLSLLL